MLPMRGGSMKSKRYGAKPSLYGHQPGWYIIFAFGELSLIGIGISFCKRVMNKSLTIWLIFVGIEIGKQR